MSEEPADSGTEALGGKVEDAQRRLRAATESAESAEKRATAEIRALEADLEKERLSAAKALEGLREGHEQDLRREREAKERAIAAAEERLAEIESHAESAENRVKEAERRAVEAEERVADAEARAREAAANWLREQVTSIRREAAGR
jgi:chromosome segregation ATPase